MTPFFSAAKHKAMGYCDAKDDRIFVDVAFSTYTSSTALAVGNRSAWNIGKFGGTAGKISCPLNDWTAPLPKSVPLRNVNI